MSEKMDVELKKCRTPKFRVSFPKVFTPEAFREGQPAKYSITCIVDKTADLTEMKRAVKNAIIEKYGSIEKKPKKFKLPFRDGSSEKPDHEEYQGKIFFSATCKNKPGLIDRQKNKIVNEEDFYAGCYAHATMIAFVYEDAGNNGVAFALQNIQKLGDGEPLGGKRSADKDFDDLGDDLGSEDSFDTEDKTFDL